MCGKNKREEKKTHVIAALRKKEKTDTVAVFLISLVNFYIPHDQTSLFYFFPVSFHSIEVISFFVCVCVFVMELGLLFFF